MWSARIQRSTPCPGLNAASDSGRVHRPAGRGRAALGEEAQEEDDPAEQEEPVRQRVQARERHVARADHQRDEEVPEPGQDRDDDEEHHRRAVDRDELVVGVAGRRRPRSAARAAIASAARGCRRTRRRPGSSRCRGSRSACGRPWSASSRSGPRTSSASPTGSALAATAASSLARFLPEVRHERVDLHVAPVLRDRAASVPTPLRDDLRQAVPLDEQRVPAEVRADQLRAPWPRGCGTSRRRRRPPRRRAGRSARRAASGAAPSRRRSSPRRRPGRAPSCSACWSAAELGALAVVGRDSRPP